MRGLLRWFDILFWPCISGDGSPSATSISESVSTSKLRTKTQPTQERVPQGGHSLPKPILPWIVGNGLLRPFHWRQSKHGPDWRQQQPRKRKGMENPVKEPNDDWLQLNLADKTLPQAISLRCQTEKYSDFTIHPLYQPFDQQLFAGDTAGSSKIPTPALSVPPSDQPTSTVSATSGSTSLKERTWKLDCIERNHP